MINIFKLHFINNTCSYSSTHWSSYIPICCIINIWKRKKGGVKRKRFKLNGKFQNWKQISEALIRVPGFYQMLGDCFFNRPNSSCVRWQKYSVEHLLQNTWPRTWNTHPSLLRFTRKPKALPEIRKSGPRVWNTALCFCVITRPMQATVVSTRR